MWYSKLHFSAGSLITVQAELGASRYIWEWTHKKIQGELCFKYKLLLLLLFIMVYSTLLGKKSYKN